MSIVILSLCAFYVFLLPLTKNTIVNYIGNNLLERGNLTKKNIVSLLNNEDLLQSKVKEYSKITGYRISVISADGRVIADSSFEKGQLKGLDNHLTRPEIIDSNKKGYGISVRYSTTIGKNLIYVALPMKNSEGRTIGYLRYSAPLGYVENMYRNLFLSTSFAILLAILISLFLSVLYSNWYYSPIKELLKLTESYSVIQPPKIKLIKSPFEFGEIETKIEEYNQKIFEYFQDLQKEKAKLSGLLSNMKEGVLAVDGNGKILFANKKIYEIFNIEQSNIIGQTPIVALRNNEISDYINEYLMNPEKIKDIEIVLHFKKKLYYNVSFDVLKNDNDEKIGLICVFYDLTKIKELEQYRSEFIANVSHELKTPLSVIRSFVETLIDGAIDDKKNRIDFLKKIYNQSINLSKLIDDIIMLSKLELKHDTGKIEEVELSEIVSKCIDLVYQNAKNKDITIIFSPQGKYYIEGIPDQIYRAILNVVDNAVNYTLKGGKIEIKLEKGDEGVNVVIKDNGIGIPQESLPRIFERFYRVDQSRSRETGGTGLGLSIVKHVMELHNGKIFVESKLGEGSTFTLFFPFTQI